MVWVPLVVAAGRLGLLRVGLARYDRRWPSLGDTTLGVVGSYRVYLTRTTLLNATFMLVAYGTAWLQWEALPWTWTTSAVAVASTGAYPWLSASSRRGRLARAAFQVGGIVALLAVVGVGTVLESGRYRYLAVLGLALLLVVVDGLPLVSKLRGG